MNMFFEDKLVDFAGYGICALFLTMFFCSASVIAQNKKPEANFKDPEKLVRHLYEQVTFPAGKTPDWDYIRTLFIKESIVVMRVGKDETATLSLDGWVLDFVNFIHNREVKKTGFQEKVLKQKPPFLGTLLILWFSIPLISPVKVKLPAKESIVFI